jgi:MinD-like ATPase involved in chromosome partitioning or flagellar assembly
MFNALAVNASLLRRQILHTLAVESGLLLLARATDQYPPEAELTRLCSLRGLDVLFLDLEDPAEAYRCLCALRGNYPDVPVVGIGGKPAQQKSLGLLGVGHFVPFPADYETFNRAVADAIRSQHQEPLKWLYTMLPAKAGSGSSTLAVSTATALAAGLEQRVLCIDADLRSGVMSMMLDVTARGSTQGALTSAYELDRFRWADCVTERLGADFLLSSGEPPGVLPDWSHYFALLRFVGEQYETILADLPDLVDGATEELVRRSHAVFVVTTQEPTALQLANRRCEDLTGWGVPRERIQLLVNRWHRQEMGIPDIEDYVGWPVAHSFPNDYLQVRAARISKNLPLSPKTPLGRAVAEFAHRLAGVPFDPEQDAGPSRIKALMRGLVSRP